jgi:tetratricopeptide (TPR) repeat protein
MFKNDYLAALKHVEEYIGPKEKQGEKVTPDGLIGFIYLKNGQKEKAAYHFDWYISNQLKLIEESQPNPGFWNYFRLMYIYSAKGEKEKALENFRKAVKCKDAESVAFNVNILFYCKYSPMYETIREEPEFMKFIRQKEDNYMTDREKIKKLFREAGVGG